jgi:transcriptional regulator with XRE-family HTH domain
MKNQTEWKLCKRNRFIVIGKELSDARVAAGKSMEEVAEALGCNKSSISRWEQESLVPSEERIFKMAEMFKTMAFVIGNPDYKNPE